MKKLLGRIFAIVAAGAIGLILLGIWVDSNTKDGIPVSVGASAPTSTPNWQQTAEAPQPTKAAEATATPNYEATVHARETEQADGPAATPAAEETKVAEATAEGPGSNGSAGACLGGDQVTISKATLDLDHAGYMVVDYYIQGQPQGVTALTFGENGDSYALKSDTRGSYWIYPASCTFDEVVQQAKYHAVDQKNDGYNVSGYAGWESTGFFVKK